MFFSNKVKNYKEIAKDHKKDKFNKFLSNIDLYDLLPLKFSYQNIDFEIFKNKNNSFSINSNPKTNFDKTIDIANEYLEAHYCNLLFNKVINNEDILQNFPNFILDYNNNIIINQKEQANQNIDKTFILSLYLFNKKKMNESDYQKLLDSLYQYKLNYSTDKKIFYTQESKLYENKNNDSLTISCINFIYNSSQYFLYNFAKLPDNIFINKNKNEFEFDIKEHYLLFSDQYFIIDDKNIFKNVIIDDFKKSISKIRFLDQNNKKDAIITFYNGDLYRGNVNVDNMPNGTGRYEFSNGYKIETIWKDGYLQNSNSIIIDNHNNHNDVHIDYCDNKIIIPNGNMMIQYNDNLNYMGNCFNGLFNGYGALKFYSKSYLGNWHKGFLISKDKDGNNSAIFLLDKNFLYNGDVTIKNDKISYGTNSLIISNNGDKYNFNISKNNLNGKGVINFSNDNYCKTEFKNGKLDGELEFIFNSKPHIKYIGPISEGELTDTGKLYIEDNNDNSLYYEINWHNLDILLKGKDISNFFKDKFVAEIFAIEKIIDIMSLLTPSSLKLSIIQGNIAWLYYKNNNDIENAIKYSKKSLELQEKHHPQSIEFINNLSDMAVFYENIEKFSDAYKCYELSIKYLDLYHNETDVINKLSIHLLKKYTCNKEFDNALPHYERLKSNSNIKISSIIDEESLKNITRLSNLKNNDNKNQIPQKNIKLPKILTNKSLFLEK
jgi:hypothetical protein